MTQTVPINSLKPHKDNPRRGNVEAIADSLEAFGQYQPIIVDAEGTIICGNHTWDAARMLGWDEIAVSVLDCDADTAKRIMLADNRTTDLASYNDAALVELLRGLEALEGTGFDDDDLTKMVEALDRKMELHVSDPEPEGEHERGGGDFDDGNEGAAAGDDEDLAGWINVPSLDQIALTPSDGAELVDRVDAVPAPPVDVVRSWLGFGPAPKRRTRTARVGAGAEATIVGAEDVAMDAISPHPANPRQGDVGAIVGSLEAFGQYRPVVANRRDNLILAGAHRWMAARSLGWETIKVTWVDVDDAMAKRIMVADNRTSDLGAYDHQVLYDLLGQVPSLEGTGYDMDDIDVLFLRISDDKRTTKNAVIVISVPTRAVRWEVKDSWRRFDQWLGKVRATAVAGQVGPEDVVAARLGLVPAGSAS